jgi:guanylate kinase
MDGVLLLISGASGAGKTSVRNVVAPDLGSAVTSTLSRPCRT